MVETNLVNTSMLRDELLNLAKNRANRDLTDHGDSPSKLENYITRIECASRVGILTALQLYPQELVSEGTNTFHVFNRLIKHDLSLACFEAASVAWLTVDNFRWHMQGHPEVSENLFYGMVQQYHNPVVQVCLTYLNNGHELLTEDMVQKAKEVARESTRALFATTEYQ